MPIYLIRHGETALNASRVFQPADTPLSELGHAQARALGERLRRLPIDALITSDLTRTMQTAQGIVEGRAPLRLHTSALLQERNLGDLRGQPYEVLGIDLHSFDGKPPNGESKAEFEERVAQAFGHVIDLHQELAEELADSHHARVLDGESARHVGAPPDPLLVVVTHGLVIRGFFEHHLQLPSGEPLPDRIANTSLSIFSASPPHLLELLNCDRHLDGPQFSASSEAHARKGFGG